MERIRAPIRAPVRPISSRRVRERVAVGYFRGSAGGPPRTAATLSRSLCAVVLLHVLLLAPGGASAPAPDRVHVHSSRNSPRTIRFRYGSSNSQYVRYGSSNSQYVRYGQYHRESVLVRFRRSGYRVMLNPPRQVPSD